MGLHVRQIIIVNLQRLSRVLLIRLRISFADALPPAHPAYDFAVIFLLVGRALPDNFVSSLSVLLQNIDAISLSLDSPPPSTRA